MDFRHEWKHEITVSDMIAIRQRLRVIAGPDTHTADGKYSVRSLYFDTFTDKALREKIDGVSIREKFRIRFYKGDLSFIRLEKKASAEGWAGKQAPSWERAKPRPLSTETTNGCLTAEGLW